MAKRSIRPPADEPEGDDVIKLTIVIKGDNAAAFRRVRRRLSPLAPERMPGTEVLLYCLRETDDRMGE